MSDVDARLSALEEKVADGFKDMNTRLAAIESMFTMGKGAVWVLTKIGAGLVLLAGAGAWLWDHFGPR